MHNVLYIKHIISKFRLYFYMLETVLNINEINEYNYILFKNFIKKFTIHKKNMKIFQR